MIAVTAAAWLLDQIRSRGKLNLEDAVFETARLFGAECLAADKTGMLSIALPVLKALRLLAGDAVVWDGDQKAWWWRDCSNAHRTLH